MKRIFLALLLMFCLTLAGCGSANSGGAAQEPAPDQTSPPAPAEGPIPGKAPAPDGGPAEPTPPAVGQVAMVYIGTKAGGFTDYPIVYDGDLTPEKLIQGIADLTGWDVTLAEDVVSGKGGMSVYLADESALFTGPPDPQREPFFVYGAEQLAETILDSIQKTLQMGFTGDGCDPDALDIWYCMEDGQPLETPALGISWPIDQPYHWTGAVSG